MKCSESIELILRGEGGDERDLAGHLAMCPECRRARDIIDSLGRLAALKQDDLSPDAVVATTRKAHAILLERRERQAGPTPVRYFLRLAAAACAAAIILITAIVFLHGGTIQPLEKVDLALSDMNQLDARIQTLSDKFGSELDGFRQRYQEQDPLDPLDMWSSSLQYRIDVCYLEVEGGVRGQ